MSFKWKQFFFLNIKNCKGYPKESLTVTAIMYFCTKINSQLPNYLASLFKNLWLIDKTCQNIIFQNIVVFHKGVTVTLMFLEIHPVLIVVSSHWYMDSSLY